MYGEKRSKSFILLVTTKQSCWRAVRAMRASFCCCCADVILPIFPLVSDFEPLSIFRMSFDDSNQSVAVGVNNLFNEPYAVFQDVYISNAARSIFAAINSYKTTEERNILAVTESGIERPIITFVSRIGYLFFKRLLPLAHFSKFFQYRPTRVD